MDTLSISLSLFALTACLAHGGWLAIGMATGRRQVTSSSPLTASLLCGLLLLAVGVDWASAESFPFLTANQLLVLLAVAAWLVIRFGWSALTRGDWSWRRWHAFGLAHLLLLAAAAWNFQTAIRANPTVPWPDQFTTKVPVEDAVVVTDQGRIFSVFRYEAKNHDFEDNSLQNFGNKVFRVALPDLATNCHGWVFAGGRYAVPEAAVAALLQDNGYAPVTEPQPNDVIVYRNEAGAILHSGRVRRVHENGRVWIESKWGPGGRYLHQPEDQCYSASFAYYRSPRPTHDAQIVQTPATKDARVARSEDVTARRARG